MVKKKTSQVLKDKKKSIRVTGFGEYPRYRNHIIEGSGLERNKAYSVNWRYLELSPS